MTRDEVGLLLWLADAFLVIVLVVVCCYHKRRHEAAATDRAQPAAVPAVQMVAMALVQLDYVSYPRHQHNDDAAVSPSSSTTSTSGGGGGGDRPAVAEECAICLGRFDDGDWCSVMPVCRHEFHRSCIAKWLTACNNTCPLCRAQLQWDVVAHDMV